MTRMTTEELEKLRVDMTPGPWSKRGVNNMVCGPEGNTVADVRYKNGADDTRAIALTPDLLAEVLELRAANARLREALDNALLHAIAWQGEPNQYSCEVHAAVVDEARAALKETTK